MAEVTVPWEGTVHCQGEAQGLGRLISWQTLLSPKGHTITRLRGQQLTACPLGCTFTTPPTYVVPGLSPQARSWGLTLCPFNSPSLKTRGGELPQAIRNLLPLGPCCHLGMVKAVHRPLPTPPPGPSHNLLLHQVLSCQAQLLLGPALGPLCTLEWSLAHSLGKLPKWSSRPAANVTTAVPVHVLSRSHSTDVPPQNLPC